MALNNRIYKYTCDTCARSIERLADPARPDPLRCVITDQCSGKLVLTSTRFGLRPNNTPTVVGLLDRIKRGSSRTEANITPQLDRINLSTFSGSNGSTIALMRKVTTDFEQIYFITENGTQRVLARTDLLQPLPPPVSITAVLFELTPAALEYKRYTFNMFERALSISGRDSSAAQSTLAFDNTSNIRVFVNGTLLESTFYDKSVPNVITFTPELLAPALLIEVFVYKSLSQFFTDEQAIRLKFESLPIFNDARTGCSWGDVATVSQGTVQYSPLYCTSYDGLDRSKTYGLVRFEAKNEVGITTAVDPIGYMLLADPPYTFQDKRLTSVVPISALTSDGFPISFVISSETGLLTAVIDGSTLTPLARALIIGKLDYIDNISAAETMSLLTARNEKTFILGPA